MKMRTKYVSSLQVFSK